MVYGKRSSGVADPDERRLELGMFVRLELGGMLVRSDASQHHRGGLRILVALALRVRQRRIGCRNHLRFLGLRKLFMRRESAKTFYAKRAWRLKTHCEKNNGGHHFHLEPQEELRTKPTNEDLRELDVEVRMERPPAEHYQLPRRNTSSRVG